MPPQIRILGISPGSIRISCLAAAASQPSLPALDAALRALQASPSQQLGADFLTAYGISSVQVECLGGPSLIRAN